MPNHLNIEICLIYKEANKCADRLVKFCCSLHIDLSFFNRLSTYISSDILANSLDVCNSKLVQM